MGHDSERAAMIYQHEARGADKAITDAIDTRVEDEQRKDAGEDQATGPLANGTLMARRPINPRNDRRPSVRNLLPTWAFTLERMTGIEPALSAWEADVLPLNYIRRLHSTRSRRAAPLYLTHRTGTGRPVGCSSPIVASPR
jgi:hypothetical protein